MTPTTVIGKEPACVKDAPVSQVHSRHRVRTHFIVLLFTAANQLHNTTKENQTGVWCVYLASGVPQCRPDFPSSPWWWTHRDDPTLSSYPRRPEKTNKHSSLWARHETERWGQRGINKRDKSSSPWVPATPPYPQEPSHPSFSCSAEFDRSGALHPWIVAMWPVAEESQW